MQKIVNYGVSSILLVVPAWSMVTLGMYFSQDFFNQPHEAYSLGFITSFFLVGYVFVINAFKKSFFKRKR